ncbi:hypothetical protein OS493_013346 [Desmophyllum pertusum]|uniref:G-protein coupled receptors family 1 profile domain-containing protein n=1 Tax=Desmophyllum pertusum TaxID=174260 RepID=A0A9W9YDG9_9CNID|nr:hypothetical protein OS493_013346 [Desmophyllum pertusum]
METISGNCSSSALHVARYTTQVHFGYSVYLAVIGHYCIGGINLARPIHHDPNEDLTEDAQKAELIYGIVFLGLFFCLPFALMCFTYASIIVEIVRQSRNIQRQHIPSSQSARRRNRHEWKAIAIFAAMMLVYIICWLPYFSLRRFDMSMLPIPLLYVITWLRYLASFLNRVCTSLANQTSVEPSLNTCVQ